MKNVIASTVVIVVGILFVFGGFSNAESQSNEINTEGSGDARKAPIKEQGSVTKRTKLLNYLTENYDSRINPDTPNGIQFGIALLDVNLNEEENTLDSKVWLRYTWEDSRLEWDAKEWGIDVLRVQPDTFWKPDIALFNSADLLANSGSCWESNILVYPNGKVLWVPPCHFTSYCKNTLKIHPFADQTCILKFGSWTFDSLTMDVNFYDNKPDIDMTDFYDLSDWKVIKTIGEKHTRLYPCCPETYTDLTYNITLRRKPEAESLCLSA